MGYLRRHPLVAACVALAAILVVALGFETGWGTSIRTALPKPSGKPAAAADARVLPPVAMGSADQAFPETANRPLFVPTRRPVPVAATAGASAMPKGSLVLAGVIVASGVRTAMLREKSTGRIHRVQQGKEVNGMSVARIEPDRVLLKQGEEEETVVMAVQKGSSAGAAASHGGPFAATPGGAPAPTTLPSTGFPTQFAGPGGQPVPGSPADAPPAAQVQPPPQAAPNAAGQTTSTGPMTPEELLARRRARRNQQ